MKKKVFKQLLTTSDEPSPIPANLYNLDLTNAIETFKPGKHSVEDLPAAIPVYDRKSGKIERFVKTKQISRRAVSMPIISKDSDLETLKAPPVPPKDSRRITSCYFNSPNQLPLLTRDKAPSVIQEEEEPSMYDWGKAYNEPVTLPPSSSKHSTMSDSTVMSSPNYYLDSVPSCIDGTISSQENFHDDLFSDAQDSCCGTSVSSAQEESLTRHESCSRILDVVEDYTSESFSILSSDFQVDLQSHSSESKLDYDNTSFIDSLFGSDGYSVYQKDDLKQNTYIPRVPAVQQTVPAEPKMPIEKDLPIPPSTAPKEQPLEVQKVRKARKQYFPLKNTVSGSNQSMMTVASNATSLKDSKKELTEAVRQRPFSFCLDAGMNYSDSPYKAISEEKKRVQSQSALASKNKPRPLSLFETSNCNPKPRCLTLGSPIAFSSQGKGPISPISSLGFSSEQHSFGGKGNISMPPSAFYRNVTNPQAVYGNLATSQISLRSSSNKDLPQLPQARFSR